MSTYWLPKGKLPFSKLKGISIDNVEEVEAKDTNDNNICLSDGYNNVWASRLSDGSSMLARYGRNNESEIVAALQEHFKVLLVCEFDERWDELLAQHPEDFLIVDMGEIKQEKDNEK